MSNWCNITLVVAGRKPAVAKFTRQARIHPLQVFSSDMLDGETMKLHASRMVRLKTRWYHKRYRFQVRNDDGISHFQRRSRSYPSLTFLLAYGDPNAGETGSAYICRGRAKRFVFSGAAFENFLFQQGLPKNCDDPDYEWKYWDAFRAAEYHAETALAHLIARPPRK
jgi:hypothetical protein